MAEISTIKDRILTYLEVKGIKKADFYITTGLSDSNFKGKNRLSQPGGDMIVKILTSYPDLSTEWLVMGKGKMLNTATESANRGVNNSNNGKPQQNITTDSPTKVAVHVPEGSHEGIPLIPLSAMAGTFTGDTSVMEYECERYVIPAFKGADFLIQVKGDSMQPTYQSGDLVACQKVPLSSLFFQWNKTYVLDTDQGPLIKRIMPGSDSEHILIVSDNNNYPPFELSMDQFYGVALVRGIVRLE